MGAGGRRAARPLSRGLAGVQRTCGAGRHRCLQTARPPPAACRAPLPQAAPTGAFLYLWRSRAPPGPAAEPAAAQAAAAEAAPAPAPPPAARAAERAAAAQAAARAAAAAAEQQQQTAPPGGGGGGCTPPKVAVASASELPLEVCFHP